MAVAVARLQEAMSQCDRKAILFGSPSHLELGTEHSLAGLKRRLSVSYLYRYLHMWMRLHALATLAHYNSDFGVSYHAAAVQRPAPSGALSTA